MLKGLFTFVCLLWILSPSASAQSAGPIGVYSQSAGHPVHIAVYSNDVVSENVCAPDVDEGLYEETTVALDDSQLARLRIELLERGLNPGFDLDAVDADARLAEAIQIFQAKSSLPVTGQADAVTLFMLSVPIEKSSDGRI